MNELDYLFLLAVIIFAVYFIFLFIQDAKLEILGAIDDLRDDMEELQPQAPQEKRL